jgi:hypothetical protein
MLRTKVANRLQLLVAVDSARTPPQPLSNTWAKRVWVGTLFLDTSYSRRSDPYMAANGRVNRTAASSNEEFFSFRDSSAKPVEADLPCFPSGQFGSEKQCRYIRDEGFIGSNPLAVRNRVVDWSSSVDSQPERDQPRAWDSRRASDNKSAGRKSVCEDNDGHTRHNSPARSVLPIRVFQHLPDWSAFAPSLSLVGWPPWAGKHSGSAANESRLSLTNSNKKVSGVVPDFHLALASRIGNDS